MGDSFEKLLGLTAKELKIHRFLVAGRFVVAESVGGSHMPRMTAHHVLKRLLARDIIRRTKRQGHFYYTCVSRETLLLSLFQNSAFPNGSTMLPVTRGVGFSVHRGTHSIYSLYEKISRESAKQRIYTIQTTKSTEYIFTHYSVNELNRIHEIMKANEVILEDIVEADFFKPIYREYGKNFPKAVRSFFNRLTVTYAIPANVLSFSCDMVICRDVVVFIDWWEETALEIRSPEMVAICRDLFESFKKDAQTVHFSELAEPYVGHKQ